MIFACPKGTKMGLIIGYTIEYNEAGDYEGQPAYPQQNPPSGLDIASRLLSLNQSVKDSDLSAKEHDLRNDCVIPEAYHQERGDILLVILSTTHLWKRDFLTVCSIPPTCEFLVSCYRSHGVALIRDVIYVCKPAVWRYAVEPPSSQHTDSKLRRRDILGPGYRSLVGIFPGRVEVINC